MRVDIVDPSAYTPPYDHALCQALAAAGADVDLITSRFAYGPVAAADGYRRRELFYRHAFGAPGSRGRRLVKLAEHVPDMLRYRRAVATAAGPDVVHFQWLTVPHLDRLLLAPRPRPARAPRGRRRTGAARRALVLTAHDIMPREPRPGQLAAQRRLYERFDAIVVHSEHGRSRLVGELGVGESRVHVIAHGAFSHLADGPSQPTAHHVNPLQPAAHAAGPLPPAPPDTDSSSEDQRSPVVLCFGLMRPYKGLEVLVDAWRGIESAELWIAGMARMDIAPLRASAQTINALADESGGQGRIRLDTRFITDDELPGYFQRADLVVLPYRQADQSGVLFTALAFGKPLLLSDVGGFPELAGTGAARIVPAGDPLALRAALAELLGDRDGLARMATAAQRAARGPYAWEQVARAHLALYQDLLA